MNKPAVVINGTVSASTSDELDKALAFNEMWACCDELNGRRCPVEKECERFFVDLTITPRNYTKKLEQFKTIKAKRDQKLKQPKYAGNQALQGSNHNGKHSPNNTDANGHQKYAYYTPTAIKKRVIPHQHFGQSARKESNSQRDDAHAACLNR